MSYNNIKDTIAVQLEVRLDIRRLCDADLHFVLSGGIERYAFLIVREKKMEMK